MSNINGSDVKRELTAKRVKGDDRLALLSGFLRVTFSLERRPREKDMSLGFDCAVDFVRRYLSACIMDEFKVSSRSDDDELPVFADAVRLLTALGIMTDDGSMALDAVPQKFENNAPYYVRGVFLGCGSLSVPSAEDARAERRSGYHLEFSFTNEGYANDFTRLLMRNGIVANRTKERTRSSEKYVVYVKDSEGVSDGLALIGAEKAVLELNEAVVALSVKSSVNRRNNCDLANMTRTANAAVGVAEAIEIISAKQGLDTLPPKLLEAAEARINSPDVPLAKLAYELGISKSGLKHRYDKIEEIARRLSKVGTEAADKGTK